MMQERNGIITMKGNPLTLLGPETKTGQTAPDATVVANDLSEVKLSAFKGKKRILSVVPSLDTAVCDIQTKKFNEEAGKLGPNVQILTISMDLPFAQKRWCGAASVSNLQTLSDHRDASFGTAYGVLIKGLRLLARAVFVIDEKDKITHVQIVKEVTQEPDYQAALEALKS
jgi:thiol peroxidase